MDFKHLQHLLEKKVSRREFLAYVGAGALAATGIAGLIKNLTGRPATRPLPPAGYGSSDYGNKRSASNKVPKLRI